MPTLKIKSIACTTQNEAGDDEIYLKVDGTKAWPPGDSYYVIEAGQTVAVNFDKTYTSEVNVELWEDDSASGHDLLGGNKFTMFQIGAGSFSCKGDDADYTVNYDVVP